MKWCIYFYVDNVKMWKPMSIITRIITRKIIQIIELLCFYDLFSWTYFSKKRLAFCPHVAFISIRDYQFKISVTQIYKTIGLKRLSSVVYTLANSVFVAFVHSEWNKIVNTIKSCQNLNVLKPLWRGLVKLAVESV